MNDRNDSADRARTPLLALALVASGIAVAVACGGTPTPPVVPDVTPPSGSDSAKPETSATPPSSGSATSTDKPPAGGGKMTAAECDALQDDANVSLDAARIEVDKTCKKDADCVGIHGRACNFTCQNGAIPKADQPKWDGVVTKVKDNQCKKWSENDCPKTSPPKKAPTCADDAKKPACNKGKCILK